MKRVNVHGIPFEIAGFSEQGPRPENQDAYTTEGFPDRGLIVVADGMGGQKSGRLAADTAIGTLQELAPIKSLEDARRALREADRIVNVTAEADPDQHGGMGCALAVLSLVDGQDGPGWIAAHVGDVRILSLSPDGVLRLETRDHTPAFARWEAGEITLDEIPDTVGANRLQRAVGRGGEADVAWLPAAAGWSWLIVSDGITKALRLDELASALALGDTDATCETIRKKVEERGPDDNYTAVVVRALGSPAAAAAPEPGTETGSADTMKTHAREGRSAGTGIALALSLLALTLGVFAVWTAREASTTGARTEELQRLRVEVDSLRGIVTELVAPFGPTEPADPLPGPAIPQPPLGR